jgi:hypothetical protein
MLVFKRYFPFTFRAFYFLGYNLTYLEKNVK